MQISLSILQKGGVKVISLKAYIKFMDHDRMTFTQTGLFRVYLDVVTKYTYLQVQVQLWIEQE